VTSIPGNDSALTGRALCNGEAESDADRDSRVDASLKDARQVLSKTLGRDVTFLCWPFDRMTPASEHAAHQAGFLSWTGGRVDNRVGMGRCALSRTHVNDYSAGPAPLWVEVLVFRARLEVAAGNLLWWPVSMLAARRRAGRFAILHDPTAQTAAGSRGAPGEIYE